MKVCFCLTFPYKFGLDMRDDYRYNNTLQVGKPKRFCTGIVVIEAHNELVYVEVDVWSDLTGEWAPFRLHRKKGWGHGLFSEQVTNEHIDHTNDVVGPDGFYWFVGDIVPDTAGEFKCTFRARVKYARDDAEFTDWSWYSYVPDGSDDTDSDIPLMVLEDPEAMPPK